MAFVWRLVLRKTNIPVYSKHLHFFNFIMQIQLIKDSIIERFGRTFVGFKRFLVFREPIPVIVFIKFF